MENERKKKFCTKCGNPLPEDSEVCSFCDIEEDVPDDTPYQDIDEDVEIIAEQNIAEDLELYDDASDLEEEQEDEANELDNEESALKVYCRKCGYLVDSDDGICTNCGTNSDTSNHTATALCWLFGILLLVFIIVSIVQYVERDDVYRRVMTQENTIFEQDEKITSQTETISSQEKEIESLGEKAEYYDKICEELNSGKLGYATEDFRVNESVILVNEYDTDRRFTLTTSWHGGGSVGVSYSGDSATVDFDEDSWGDSTTMTVVPNCQGVTVATFSNTMDSNTFKIIIIVTE